jgi:hypothetical protein
MATRAVSVDKHVADIAQPEIRHGVVSRATVYTPLNSGMNRARSVDQRLPRFSQRTLTTSPRDCRRAEQQLHH